MAHSKQQTRALFQRFEQLRKVNWNLTREREHLELELSRLSSLPRIDSRAREGLGMIAPHPTKNVTYYTK